MSSLGCLLWGINLLTSQHIKYKKICSEPELKETTGYFGIYSIVVSIFVGALFVLSLWGILALMNSLNDADIGTILMWVFIIMLIIVALFLFAEYIFGGLMSVIYQFRCNLRPISWIALAVFVVTTAAMVFGILYVFDLTGL